MRKYGRLAVLLCLCALFLGGCGGAKVPDVVEVPTVSVDKDGIITVWQIGECDKAYYNLAELSAMAESEAAQYNAEKGREGAVVLEKAEALDAGKVMVVYRFDGWESCSDFCEEKLFFGTVQEAAQNGFDTDIAMKSVKDGAAPAAGLLQETGKLVVTGMKADIYCSGKVAYISEGAAVNGDGSIKSSGETELTYILLK